MVRRLLLCSLAALAEILAILALGPRHAAAEERPLYYDRALTPADLEGRTLRELTLMRNTIYARAGHPFRKKWLGDYLSAQPWYHPLPKDGTIYRLMPETCMARHCIGLNHIAIGVENVGDDRRWPLTAAQVEADARLVRWLAARFPITHLVGHSEAGRLEGHAYFVERDPRYRNQKPDPGARFMARVRERVADLGLEGAP